MSGGTFTFNPALADELGRARIRQAAATGAPILVTQSSMCRDHLARCAQLEGVKLDVRNVTEFLAARSGALAAAAATLWVAPGAPALLATGPAATLGAALTSPAAATSPSTAPGGNGGAAPPELASTPMPPSGSVLTKPDLA